MRRILTLLLFALAIGMHVLAQSPGLTGQWRETTGSGLNAELNLKATGATFTGTFTVRGRQMTIADGKLTNNTLTFKAAMGDEPEGFSGELKGDEILLWRDRNGKVDAVTLRRLPAASLTGRWQGQTPNGMSLTLDLTASGQTLTGTLTREGESATISNGKVSQNTFTFTGVLSGTPETIEGTVEGDTIKAWLTRQGPERAAILKRVAK